MEKQLSKKRKRQFTIIAILLGLLFTWGVAEVVFRTLVYMKSQKYPTATTEVDEILGWRAIPNFKFKGTVPDGTGVEYNLDFSTDENGFRYFGDKNNSNNKKLLIIGDSYTHAIEVSNDKTYYGLFLDSLKNVEMFTYGARGIGSLQQKLWLDKWYPIINPDVVIWQFCFNDVYNLSYDLEHSSYFNNNRRMRPYFEKGEIVYKNPARLGMGSLRKFSKFIDFIATKVEIFIEGQNHKNGIASEDFVAKEGKGYAPYQESLKILDEVIKSVKTQIDNNVPILAFPVDNTKPYLEDMTEVFQQNGIPVIQHIPILINEAKKAGTSVSAKDKAHWNEKAHEMANKELWKYLKPMLFPPNSVELQKQGWME